VLCGAKARTQPALHRHPRPRVSRPAPEGGDDGLDSLVPETFAQLAHRGAERGRMGQQRRDVAEQDGGLGEIRDVADEFLQIDRVGWHTAPRASGIAAHGQHEYDQESGVNRWPRNDLASHLNSGVRAAKMYGLPDSREFGHALAAKFEGIRSVSGWL
jgi:hypothetical protein